MMKSILIFEDDQLMIRSLERLLSSHFQLSFGSSLEEAHKFQPVFDFYLIDCDLSYEEEGLEILELFANAAGKKIFLTGRDQESIIKKAYEAGADEYILKPLCAKTLFQSLAHSENCKQSDLSLRLQGKWGWAQSFCQRVEAATQSQQPVYFTGETGVGKTALAQMIHDYSNRHEGPFISLNCSEFNENLLESEIFGHVKGAFTGADQPKKGKLLLAHRGTLFLDEVATMPKALQLKLLKVIDEKKFYPMGSDKPEHSDFRIMSATCEDLEQMVQRGEFRQDLYYRLMGHGLNLVPLRSNKDHLTKIIKKSLNSDGKRRLLSSEAWDTLLNYPWPGNYREFYKEIEMLFEKNRGMIQVTDLSPAIINPLEKSKKSDYLDSLFADACENGLQETLAKIQQELIQYSFERNDGQVRKTLKELKISSHAFYKMPLRRGTQVSEA